MPRTLLRSSSERGFGLVELLVVVAILGVLVLVAIPVFGAVQNNAKNEAVQSALKSAAMQLEVQQESSSRPINVATASANTKLNMGPRANYISHVQDYGLLCGNAAGAFAIYAAATTGKVFYYSSTTKAIGEHTTTWPISGGDACPAAGVSSPGWRWANEGPQATPKRDVWPIH